MKLTTQNQPTRCNEECQYFEYPDIENPCILYKEPPVKQGDLCYTFTPKEDFPEQNNTIPPYRVFNFEVQCGNPASEAVNLLSQAMDGFKELSPHEVDSIAHWFFKYYSFTKDK